MSTPVAAVALVEKDGMILTTKRRGTTNDYALIGGKIEPTDASPYDAMKREVAEEAGIEVLSAHCVFERVDEDGNVAWCYRVSQYEGEPRTVEPDIEISWQKPEALLADHCTFREYNRQLLKKLGYYIDLTFTVPETSDGSCEKAADGRHCVHWWDGDGPCCSCGSTAELDNG